MKKNHTEKRFFISSGMINLIIVLSCFAIPAPVFSQIDTVYVPSDIPPGEGNLNRKVQEVIDSGNLSNTVFKLEPNGLYVLIDSILVPAEEHLTIVALEPGENQITALPQLLWTSADSVSKNYIFYCLGNITLKNIWLLYADTDGAQVGSTILIEDNPDININERAIFEGVVFDYSSHPSATYGGAVTITADNFVGTFKNCYFKNCIDPHFKYYGRAVSFPFGSTAYHIDSLIFENCTFANIGYVYMQEKGQYADFVKFNHCTFLDVVMFSLQSGWWNRLAVTNSIFVNTHMYGDIPDYYSDLPREPTYDYYTKEPYGGTLRIDSLANFEYVFSFGEQERRILFANSSYYIEAWLTNWLKYLSTYQPCFDCNPITIRQQPMLSPGTLVFFDSSDINGDKIFPFMNRASLYDSTNPGFILPPSDTTLIKEYLFKKLSSNADTNWAYKPEVSVQRKWPLGEDLSYTNQELKTAGMGGFPLGDLYRWWPEEYAQWKLQEEDENARISYWLETGIDSVFTDVKEKDEVVNSYELFQNYPNPFNPTTTISWQSALGSWQLLKIYDVLGNEIATLVDEYKPAGTYKISFDASEFASGVYFYQLSTTNFVETKKFILMK